MLNFGTNFIFGIYELLNPTVMKRLIYCLLLMVMCCQTTMAQDVYDDYLAKPFGMMEMLSRIKAVLRRVYKDESHVYVFEDIKLDDTSHEVSVNNKLIELTLKEYELLKLLLSNPRRVITRDELMSVVWDSEIYGETRTVDVHVASLRTKLGNSGSYIKTIRGVGYRLKEES